MSSPYVDADASPSVPSRLHIHTFTNVPWCRLQHWRDVASELVVTHIVSMCFVSMCFSSCQTTDGNTFAIAVQWHNARRVFTNGLYCMLNDVFFYHLQVQTRSCSCYRGKKAQLSGGETCSHQPAIGTTMMDNWTQKVIAPTNIRMHSC